ncbi:MAG: CcdB family protein [Deltaproteobacteria bacterium]|nr:CcdB family protein [Deltaproteobacteria bacterium]
MAQLDVYENPNPATQKEIPYLLDVQTGLLEGLASRMVVPLVKASTMGKAAQRLNPRFTVGQTEVIMSTAELAGIPTRFLGQKVGSLADRRDEIIAALDFLFSGY